MCILVETYKTFLLENLNKHFIQFKFPVKNILYVLLYKKIVKCYSSYKSHICIIYYWKQNWWFDFNYKSNRY